MLCDCPGLVFPSFVSTKAEMVCNGVLPIDQLRDPIPPMVLVANRIPRSILESTYTMQIIRYGSCNVHASLYMHLSNRLLCIDSASLGELVADKLVASPRVLVLVYLCPRLGSITLTTSILFGLLPSCASSYLAVASPCPCVFASFPKAT